MTGITILILPPSFRTKKNYLLKIKSGVYIGNINSKERQLLWDNILCHDKAMIWMQQGKIVGKGSGRYVVDSSMGELLFYINNKS